MLKLINFLVNKLDGKNRAYVSEADQFLQDFDRSHPEPSASQAKEFKKHEGIFSRKQIDRIKW